jgi:hypothetical protein
VNALDERLEQVFADEPPLGDAVDGVFRRAEHLRRRQIRRVLLTGAVVVVLVVTLGYVLTSVLLPGTTTRSAAGPPSRAAATDPVLALVAPDIHKRGWHIFARPPAAGAGWRRYLVLNGAGRPRGLVEIAVYSAPKGLCLPVLADRNACALPDHTPGGIRYARYSFDTDVDRQANEVIARRLPDGRTIAVMATGERGTGDANAGRPPLTAAQTAKVATDPRLMDAFGAGERCNDPAPACPIMKVEVAVA